MAHEKQGNMRTAPSNDVRRARYVHPDCAWQGGSKADCVDVFQWVDVRGAFPAPFERRVKVCRAHYAPFCIQAKKDGHLA